MKALGISFISGVLFSIGLVISGMTNPQKVIGFLDIFGDWDYSLALVMGGAVGFNLITFSFLKGKKPYLSPQCHLPTKTQIDAKLLGGAILFGVGWGIAGICPGPGIVNLTTFHSNALLFIISMLVGMTLFKIVFNFKKG